MRNTVLVLFLFVSAIFGQSSFFRFTHGIADEASPLTVVVSPNISVTTGLTFGMTSNYATVTPGSNTVTITNQNNVVLFSGSVTLNAYTYYTLIGAGLTNTTNAAQNISFTLVTDTNSAPAVSTTASIKFVHGIADLGALDIKFNGNQLFNQIPFKGVSPYTTLSAGTYSVQIIVHGTNNTVNVTLSFQAGGVYTIFALGIIAGTHTLALQLDDSYTYPQLRVVYGVLGGNPINVAIYNPNDNTNQQVATDLVFGAFSNYGTFSISASQIVTVVDSTNKVLFKGPVSFDPTVENTFVVFLNETVIQTTVLQDDLSPTAQYFARIKFFYGVSNSEPVAIKVNGVVQISSVAFGTSSSYITLPTLRDPSTVEVVSANGTTVFTLATTFVSGSSYTIAAFGEAGKAGATLFIKTDSAYSYVSVRFTNAVPNIPTVTLSTNQQEQPINFGQTIEYLVLPLGGNTFTFSYGGNVILSVSPTLVMNTFNSAVLVGVYNNTDPTSVTLQLYTDINTAPQTSKQMSVRVIHVAPGVGPVTLFGNGAAAFPAVSYLQSSQYNNNLAGNLQYLIQAIQGNATLATTSAFAVGGGIYTIFLFGEPNSLSIVPVPDEAYNYFSIRAVHAVPDSGAVDIVLDDKRNPLNKIFSQIAYKSVSQYLQIPMNGLNLTILVQSNGNTLLSLPYSFAPNDAYTVAVTGLVNKYNNQSIPLNIEVLIDNLNAPTLSTSTNLRVIHLAPAVPAVDVFLNSVVVPGWTDLAFQSSTPYSSQSIVSANNRIDIYQTGTNTNLLTIPNLVYNGGEVSSIIVFGTPNALVFVSQNDVVYTYFNLRLAHASPGTNSIQVLINGQQPLSDSVPFMNISAWTQVVGAATYNVTIIDAANGAKLIENDVNFQANFDITIVLAGFGNTSSEYQLLIVSNTGTPPSSFTQSKLRVANLVPGAPIVNVKFQNYTGVTYNNVGYLTITDYQELPQGIYTADIYTQGSNTSISQHPILNLAGGSSYTTFAEGVLSSFSFVQVVDYFPPSDFNLRVLHASPNVPVVDALVDGSSKGFNGLGFSGGSEYVSFSAGVHNFTIQPTNQKIPSFYYINTMIDSPAYYDYTYLLIGLYNNVTNGSTLGLLELKDDNTLPIKSGDVRVRFVHASPNAPPVNLRISGVQSFTNVSYKGVSGYTDVANGLLQFDVVTTSNEGAVLSSTLDLRVRTPGGKAVYTVVAEGLVNGNPPFKLYAFLDNGEMPPDDTSSSQTGSGLSGVAIGLIIAGVAVFVIVVGAAGFIFWKKRSQRAGYSEIESHSH